MNLRRIGSSLTVALTLLFGSARLAHAVPVISAPFVTVGVGDTFIVPISITGAVDLTSWQFDLGFNPTIVKANSVTEGPFMLGFGTTLSPPTTFVPGAIDNTSGLISLVTDSFNDLPPLPSGDGILANIEFTALAIGVSPLTFANAFLTNDGLPLSSANGDFTLQNGQITVTGVTGGGGGGGGGGGTVPEPGALALFMSGFALLGARELFRSRRSARS